MAYWFRPRRYGYGAVPTTWQGVVTLIALPTVIVGAALLLFLFDVGPGGPSIWRFVAYVVVLLVGLFVFISLIRAKTEGVWRWRWGKDN